MKTKKLLSMVLALCMLLSVVPMMSIAASAAPTGTAISGAIDVYTISENGSYYLSGNTTGRIVVNAGVTATLDLNGYVLNANNQGRAFTVNGSLTLNDSNTGEQQHHFSEDTAKKWIWDSTEQNTTHVVSGGCITAGNQSKADGGAFLVNNGGSLVMNGGNICGNWCGYSGGGVRTQQGGSFTFNDGLIAGNQTGYDGYNNAWVKGPGVANNGTFIMNGGTISHNVCYARNDKNTYGGGVYNFTTNCEINGGKICNNAAIYGGGFGTDYPVTIKNCEITGNTATKYEGGGIYANQALTLENVTIKDNTAATNGGGVFAKADLTLSGNTVITDNKVGTADNNLYLCIGKLATLSNPGSNMKIGVTLQDGEGEVTTANSADCTKYFTSDNVDLPLKNGTGNVVRLGCPLTLKVNETDGTDDIDRENGATYKTIAGALAKAKNGDTIWLTSNVTETVTIPTGKNIILDLNGYVLNANNVGTAVVVNGSLTLNDSNTGEKQYRFTRGDRWTWNKSGDTWMTYGVTGGCITAGSNASANGGAFLVNAGGSLVMNGGNICGNYAKYSGGGVYVNAGGSFTLNNGLIAGNNSGFSTLNGWVSGGGVSNNGTFIMNGGMISYNQCLARTSKPTSGGGVYNNGTTCEINGGTISCNGASNGGGIYAGTTLTLENVTIQENTASASGKGVYANCNITLAGNTVITDNGYSGARNNLFLNKDNSANVTIKSGFNGNIGVTLSTTTGQFATGVTSATDATYFTSDNQRYGISYNNSGLYVSEVDVTGVDINMSSIDMNVGETSILEFTVSPQNATINSVVWSSNKESVATVDEYGNVTAMSPGVAVITATSTDDTNISDTCTVTVVQLDINKTITRLKIGNSETLSATALPEGVIWSSSNESVATVDQKGNVTAVSPGIVDIKATSSCAKGVSVSCKVWVISSDNVSYLDENGTNQTLTENYLPVTAETINIIGNTWTSGWYVVDGEVSTDSTITIDGDVRVILKNGASLTAQTDELMANTPIYISNADSEVNAKKLSIFAQSTDSATMGKLNVSADIFFPTPAFVTGNFGNLLIAGGIINAYSDSGNAIAVGDNGNITITGGIINAYSNKGNAIAVGDNGNITITGGIVNANVGSSMSFIDNINIPAINAGSGGAINITGGTVTVMGAGKLDICLHVVGYCDAIVGTCNLSNMTIIAGGDPESATMQNSVEGFGYVKLVPLPEDVKNATYSASLTLGKNIDVNFKMSNIANADKDKLSITVDDTPVSFELKDGVANCVLKAVEPSEIGKDIHVVVTYDGVTVKDFNYSIAKYCAAAFKAYENNNDTYANLKALCEAILNYGKYAEDYANGNTDSTVNEGHEVNFSTVSLPQSKKVFTPNTTYGGTGSGAYLTLGSTIKLNYLVKTTDFEYMLTLVNGMTNAEAIAQGKYKTGRTPYARNFFILNENNEQIDPAKIEVTEVDGGYIISVDLYAYQLGNEYTLKVKGVEAQDFSITYGVYDYCTEVQGMSGENYTDTLKTLCKAIYNYSEAVKTYANAQ